MNAAAIRSELAQTLGQNGRAYWRCLSSYLKGEIPRYEFEPTVREWINTPELGTCASIQINLIDAHLAYLKLNCTIPLSQHYFPAPH